MTPTIHNAIGEQVTAFAGTFSPPLSVGFPGLPFTPPSTGQWLELKLFSNGNEDYGLADDGPSNDYGFFRVILNTRPGDGFVNPADVTDAACVAWRKGTMIAEARVERPPSVMGPVTEPDRIQWPVTVRYRATRT